LRGTFWIAARSIAARALFKVGSRQQQSRTEPSDRDAPTASVPRACHINAAAENETMKATPRPPGPMSRYELYCWHRANGTLALFFAMFGR
jgi:hypothetical protein